MDWLKQKKSIADTLKKYRWAVVILLIGLGLMAVPEPREETIQIPSVSEEDRQGDLQQQLEQVLSQLDGAGKVRVLLSAETGEQVLYQTDEDRSESAGAGDLRRQTVIVSGSDRSETALVRRKDPPTYLGAVVLCQGADRATVRLSVVEAVSTATGLTADKISVLKRK